MKNNIYLIYFVISLCFLGCKDTSSELLNVLKFAHENFLKEHEEAFKLMGLDRKEYYICFSADFPSAVMVNEKDGYKSVQIDNSIKKLIGKQLVSDKICNLINEDEMIKKIRDKSQKNNLIIAINNLKQKNDLYHVTIGYVFSSKAAIGHSYLIERKNNGYKIIRQEPGPSI